MGLARNEMQEGKSDLTPMIDVVFQLLIFMMLITSISSLKDVELPVASMAQPDEKPPKDRLVIDILKDKVEGSHRGIYNISSQTYSPRELITRLRSEANKNRSAEKLPNGESRSETSILIRCDRRVYFEDFERILKMCVNPNWGIFMYKIEIAIAKDDEE
jgi:biopolymer transport protein ExbD